MKFRPSFFFSRSLNLSLEPTLVQDSIWAQAHTLIAAHGDDVPFEVAHSGVPHSLVYNKLAQAVVASVLVGL